MKVVRNARTLLILFGFLMPSSLAFSAAPEAFLFSSLKDALPDDAGFKPVYSDQQFSVASAINNQGQMMGYRFTEAGEIRAFNLFIDAPLVEAINTDDFMPLAGGDGVCIVFRFFSWCVAENSFGIGFSEGGAITTAHRTEPGEVLVEDSLPFYKIPGTFVEENDNGVIVSTQINDLEDAVGYIIQDGLDSQRVDEVQWFTGINENENPQAIGYSPVITDDFTGEDGDCFIYGINCLPPLCHEDDVEHNHPGGLRRHSDGQGRALGHHCLGQGNNDSVDDLVDEGRIALNAASGHPAAVASGALMVQIYGDNNYEVFSFGDRLGEAWGHGQLARLFPLAINNNHAVLRGNFKFEGHSYNSWLMDCEFNPEAIDDDEDGLVDCIGGLQPLGSLANPAASNSVIGYTLKNNGTLIGHWGGHLMAVKKPFVIDLTLEDTSPVRLSGLIDGLEGWELNITSDMNNSDMGVGYGFQNCSLNSQAYRITADVEAEGRPAIQFPFSVLDGVARVHQGEVIDLDPEPVGGSQYEYRTYIATPHSGWSLLDDWNLTPSSFDTSDFIGNVCARIQVRELGDTDPAQEEVYRFKVLEDLPGNSDETRQDEETGNSNNDNGQGNNGSDQEEEVINDASPLFIDDNDEDGTLLGSLHPASGIFLFLLFALRRQTRFRR